MEAWLLVPLVTFVLGIATNWATTRRTLALQYDADLRRDRLSAYAALWARLEVLNKYGRTSQDLSRHDAERLISELKRWYFHTGGIYLSEPTRDDYFALQDALQHAVASARSDQAAPPSADAAAFEFVRLRASRLRTSLTRDVGTRKTLKLRGEPNRPPIPSELGRYRRDTDATEVALSRARSLRLGKLRLGAPVTIQGPSGDTGGQWSLMRWDNDAWAILAIREVDGIRERRALLLETNRLVEGPADWNAFSQDRQTVPVTWTRVSPAE